MEGEAMEGFLLECGEGLPRETTGSLDFCILEQ